MKIEIQAFYTDQGKVPFDNWVRKLELTNYERIYQCLEKVHKGNTCLLKSLGKGLFEIKISFKPGYRIYCLYSSNRHLLILNGGTKHTQSKDVKKAREYQKI